MRTRNVLIVASLLLAGCGEGDFNYGKVGNVIGSAPIHLDAEYVMLSRQQMDCGVQEDLWEAPSDSGGRQIARLTQKGRDLHFSDDVAVSEMKVPYVQVRGDFTLAAVDIQSDRQGPDEHARFVDVKLGVPISHSCFPQPLLMMGVRKGNFTQEYAPTLLFRYNNGWYVDKIVH